jgi:Methyltransferase domain
VTFAAFVLAHLPGAPARVLEVGCGSEGGVTPVLAAAGYDVLAIDPLAPVGPWYRPITLEELDDGSFAAAVCGRVLHHVRPLAPALDKLAARAPLVILDEFSADRIDGPAQAWYEARRRLLVAAGQNSPGPASLDEWRGRHPGLHTLETLKEELDRRFNQLVIEQRPYLYRWLGDPESEGHEQHLIEAGALRAIGWRYVGERRESSAYP